MTTQQSTPDDAAAFRARVRERLSQRNRVAAVVAILAAPVPVAAAMGGFDATGWPLMIALVAGPAAMLLWHIRSGLRPQVVCPHCGDNWEYDAMLRSAACDECGLSLPNTAEGHSSAHGPRVPDGVDRARRR